jgi:hypothetical protein
VAFAMTAGHELLRQDGLDLSEEFLHWAAKQRDGLPVVAEGTTLAAAAAALADLGQPQEALWPYDDRRDQRAGDYRPPDGVRAAALARRTRGGGAVQPKAPEVRAALDRGLGVLLGIRLYRPWYEVAEDGRIAMPTAGAAPFGGHAVLVVGYRDGDGEGGGTYIVRNSWGADWGADGYGFLPYAYVDANGIAAWGLALDAI